MSIVCVYPPRCESWGIFICLLDLFTIYEYQPKPK
nr:MAG TPA: hypothetical protein [Caudoviricetes sp.]DAR85751.1 MAG TPA: hypothetical protein [Caudoviricetes sp.]DAT97324.1 MAG TPA: hypothetical protein [Caudoviricetes sp.]